jgi:hypothetical protein
MLKEQAMKTVMIGGMLTALFVVALYLGGTVVNQRAFADETKEASYQGGVTTANAACSKDLEVGGCKDFKERSFTGSNVNKAAREACEFFEGKGECEKVN